MFRGRDDVAWEMALLVEGLGTAGDTAIEEYIVGPHPADEADGGDRGSMLGSAIGLGSRQGSVLDHLRDSVVALLGSVHDLKPTPAAAPEGSMLFSNLGSMLSFHDKAPVD
ncbi:hexose transporter [Panicum miliaceum]|uniref:Hexose transporter n=1 Tax=Panicum miliaceum TaxID=4540 RepID=A0A3L6PH64_PANMI|nr:hexose transporter [Panicum miliaceum]